MKATSPSRLSSVAMRFGTALELMQLLKANGRWWLVPMIVVMGLFAVLLVLVQAVEYVAPFVYTIF